MNLNEQKWIHFVRVKSPDSDFFNPFLSN